MWKEINGDMKHIKALVKFCKASPSKVNLIQYNKTENSFFTAANDKMIQEYISELEKNKIPVTIRKSRGNDIDSACGQLANRETN